jgi:hypothetical protein
MADIIDDSQELQEAQIAAALAKRMKVPEKTGLCLACDTPVTVGVFCDADCREFYERAERIRAIKGKSK